MNQAFPATISFARGAPSIDIIAVDDLRAAADAAFTKDPLGAFSYGTAVGYLPLRRRLAERHGVEENQVLVTNGSMQADAFLFELMVAPGDTVIVEQPTYDRTLLNLRCRGAEFLPIPLEADGLAVDRLESALRAGARPRLAHIIPNFHNPAGCTLSREKRERLLALAGEFEFTIFEDDPYVDLVFEGAVPPRMFDLDDDDRVVYVSSFTKTVCPGLRVGYVVGPSKLVARITTLATNTYISPGMVAQAIAAEFCASGMLDRSIATVRGALHERRDAVCAALRRELPEASFVTPGGGYFVWIEMPAGFDTAAALAAAEAAGVTFVKGADFMLEGGTNAFRLAYSGVTPAEIDEGIARLAGAIRG